MDGFHQDGRFANVRPRLVAGRFIKQIGELSLSFVEEGGVRPPSGCSHTVYHIDHSHRKLKVHGSNSTCQYKVSCESIGKCRHLPIRAYELAQETKLGDFLTVSPGVRRAPRVCRYFLLTARARAQLSTRISYDEEHNPNRIPLSECQPRPRWMCARMVARQWSCETTNDTEMRDKRQARCENSEPPLGPPKPRHESDELT